EAGDGVGRAGPRSDEENADLAGRARVAFRGVSRALLVADEDVAKLVLVEDGVVDRQHRAARIAEHHLDALVLQRLDDHFGAGHVLGHVRNSPPYLSSIGIRGNKKGPQRGLRVSASKRVQILGLPALQRQRYNKLRHVASSRIQNRREIRETGRRRQGRRTREWAI